MIVATAAFAGFFAFVISMAITPIYEAKTTFYLASNAESPRYLGGPETPPEPLFPTPDEKTAALNVGILRGSAFMTAMAKEFGLPVALVRKRVDVTVSGEFMVDLFVRSEDAGLTSRMANRAPALYAEFHRASMRQRAQQLAQTLSAHIADLENQLIGLEAQSEVHRRRFGATLDEALIARLSDRRATTERRLQEIDGSLAAALARRVGLEAELETERRTYAAGETVLTTPVLDLMVEQLLTLHVELAAARDGPQSPRRGAVEEQIAATETAIEGERARMAAAVIKSTGSNYELLRGQIATAKAEEAAVTASRQTAEAQLAAAKADLDAAIAFLSEAEQLAAKKAEVAAQVSDARINLASARLQAENAEVPMVVVEEASVPTRPAFPIPLLNGIVAVLAGAVAGFYYALFIGHAARARQKLLSEALRPPRFTGTELAHLQRLAEVSRGAAS
ncbi:GumC domain-containing protein [Rhodobacter ferrooxidans]|uniref:hypothetical protein n=1 Tax=Rhodobacter ferrooxidans TaxID=371731 RepID=UPI0003091B2B|nr:hypothetical protein [Rhodobacter sp. SW2]